MEKKIKLAGFTTLLMCLIIASVALSELLGGIWHYVFYQFIYCVIISICVPLYFYRKKGENKRSYLGIKPLKWLDFFVIVVFVAFSIGGQMMGIKPNTLNFSLLPLSLVPLIMTTFSEEFLFRGFIQLRFEEAFGPLPAIIVSGLCFSLYHLGYPGFRTLPFITLLFFVGLMFAICFKLGHNNVVVSYFVNLPNAYLTYLIHVKNFPAANFTKVSTFVTSFIILLTALLLAEGLKKRRLV